MNCQSWLNLANPMHVDNSKIFQKLTAPLWISSAIWAVSYFHGKDGLADNGNCLESKEIRVQDVIIDMDRYLPKRKGLGEYMERQ